MKKKVSLVLAILILIFARFVYQSWTLQVRSLRKTVKEDIRRLKLISASQTSREQSAMPKSTKSLFTEQEQTEREEAAVQKGSTEDYIRELVEGPLVRACDDLSGRSRVNLAIEKDIEKGRDGSRLAILGWLYARFAAANFQYRLPHNSALLLAAEKDVSLLSDISFAYTVRLARQELEANLDVVRDLEFRNYYAWKVAEAISKDLKYYKDPKSQDLCRRFADMTLPFSREEANIAMGDFLSQMNLTATDIDFNPNFQPDIQIKRIDNGTHQYYSQSKDLMNIDRLLRRSRN